MRSATSRADDRQPAVAPDVRRRRALLPAARRPTACWRSASAASRAGATSPDYLYFGGNSELRGYDYLRVPRQQGVLRQRRAALPADRSGADADRRRRRPARRVLRQHRRRGLRGPADDRSATQRSDHGRAADRLHVRSDFAEPGRRRSTGRRSTITGFRLVDGRASYGIGLETFALGFPIHFDWSWRTLFNKDWEDYVYLVPGRVSEGDDRQPLAAQGRSSPSGSATTSREQLPAASFQLARAGVRRQLASRLTAGSWKLVAGS